MPRDTVKLWHRLRRHNMVEYFNVDDPVRVEGDGFVNLTGQKRTIFWLCSCGEPLAIYDENAYARWVAEHIDGDGSGE
jgi:hypothetical protein